MKIVVGYDGSDASKRVLDRAAALANDQSNVVVIAVAEPYPRSGITIPANRDRDEIRKCEQDLDNARRMLSSRGIHAETLLARGDPAEQLLDASKDADLLIVGRARLPRLKRLVLGSVSSKVVRDAPCDVLVVR
jgi:nucleotide-binding universal stress UspA family protein